MGSRLSRRTNRRTLLSKLLEVVLLLRDEMLQLGKLIELASGKLILARKNTHILLSIQHVLLLNLKHFNLLLQSELLHHQRG